MVKTVLLCLLCFIMVACKPDQTVACDLAANNDVNLIVISNKKTDCPIATFDIEVALTQAQQMQGLMNRESLAEDAGMLFMFNEEAERGFWMKNTLIPLDLIFIKKGGYIHHIHSNAKPHDLTSIKSHGPVIAVLEINGGLSKKQNINVGDNVHHPFFVK